GAGGPAAGGGRAGPAGRAGGRGGGAGGPGGGPAEPAVTADGTRIEVAANAGSPEDVRHAVDSGADGIGLLRTEFLFLDASRMPTEAEQAAVYADLTGVLAGRTMIIRTLDVGAGKTLP